jgi:cytosine/adenosine deaminase-related metal-dependent hydrolase
MAGMKAGIGSEGEKEVLLSGTILVGEDFHLQQGYVCLHKGRIKEIGRERVAASLEGLVVPCMVNAHTHIGDSVLKDPPYASLEDLVGPGGLKDRTLAATPRSSLVEGMVTTLKDMVETGCCAFADFREGGAEGVDILLDALVSSSMIARVLGRPVAGSQEVHQACWGLGISSTRDHPLAWLERVVERAKGESKKIAIHAGEAGREDIQPALDLNADILVHLSRAEPQDLKKVRDAGTSVVICPRSNLVTGAGLPNLAEMLRLGITVGVGTDNVMLNSPILFPEMELISKALLHDDRQVFKMCTLFGAKILGIEDRVGSITVGKEGRVMVVDLKSKNMRGSVDPLASLVRRARPSDILAVF